jgi:hypothetical protein
MAKTPDRLSPDRVEEIIRKLSMKNIRSLFFDKYGPKMDALLCREDILGKLKIESNNLNALEYKGVDGLLGLGIHNLKRFAQKRKYNWIEITIFNPKNKRKYVYYGFTTEIDQIDANIDRFTNYKERFAKIAKTTLVLGETQKKEIRAAA